MTAVGHQPMDLETLVRHVVVPLVRILDQNDVDTRERLEALEVAHGKLVEHVLFSTPPALRVLVKRLPSASSAAAAVPKPV